MIADEITGTVIKVGDNLVQLSNPPRKEFYDVINRFFSLC
jgi:hypothetical protein